MENLEFLNYKSIVARGGAQLPRNYRHFGGAQLPATIAQPPATAPQPSRNYAVGPARNYRNRPL
jgi:hypothetical protein